MIRPWHFRQLFFYARRKCHVIFVAVALGITSAGQVQNEVRNKTKDEQAQELLNDGKHSFEDLLKGDPGAIANMKKIFELTTDSNMKLRAASLLIFIKTKESLYFDFLVHEANQALNNDMPWPTLYDKDGNKITKRVSEMNPEFLKWCEAHQANPSDEFFAAYYKIPIPWYHLAGASDPRTYALLIQGLHSRNPMIVGWAAYGLARLRDSRAIDELIDAARHAPNETRYGVIESLVTFADMKAQAAAEELATDKKLLAELRTRVKKPDYKLVFDF